ncbi:hypothetical protein V5O48_019327, partial [Marasmius crinis-equi]
TRTSENTDIERQQPDDGHVSDIALEESQMPAEAIEHSADDQVGIVALDAQSRVVPSSSRPSVNSSTLRCHNESPCQEQLRESLATQIDGDPVQQPSERNSYIAQEASSSSAASHHAFLGSNVHAKNSRPPPDPSPFIVNHYGSGPMNIYLPSEGPSTMSRRATGWNGIIHEE